MKTVKLMFLYRLYNGRNHVLYVGITNNPNRRFAHHARNQGWWSEVKRHEVWEIPADEARDLERHFINQDRPRYNVQHNTFGLRKRRAPYVPPDPFVMSQPLPPRWRNSTLHLTPPGWSLHWTDAAYAMGFTQVNFGIISEDPTFPREAAVVGREYLMYNRDELKLWFDCALKVETDDLASRPPPPPPEPDRYPMWTLEEAGQVTGWGITAMRRAKKDPTFPLGQRELTSKRLRYRRDEIEAWLCKAWEDATEAAS